MNNRYQPNVNIDIFIFTDSKSTFTKRAEIQVLLKTYIDLKILILNNIRIL